MIHLLCSCIDFVMYYIYYVTCSYNNNASKILVQGFGRRGVFCRKPLLHLPPPHYIASEVPLVVQWTPPSPNRWKFMKPCCVLLYYTTNHLKHNSLLYYTEQFTLICGRAHLNTCIIYVYFMGGGIRYIHFSAFYFCLLIHSGALTYHPVLSRYIFSLDHAKTGW